MGSTVGASPGQTPLRVPSSLLSKHVGGCTGAARRGLVPHCRTVTLGAPGGGSCQQQSQATHSTHARGRTEFGALHISWSDGTKQTISPQRMGGRRVGSGRALIGGGGGPCRSGRRGPQQLPAKGLPLLAADVGLGNDLEVLGPQHRGLVCDATRRVTSGRSHRRDGTGMTHKLRAETDPRTGAGRP